MKKPPVWDYRVVVTYSSDGPKYAIHEVFYEPKFGAASHFSPDPGFPQGATPAELLDNWKLYAKALRKDTLDEKDFDPTTRRSKTTLR